MSERRPWPLCHDTELLSSQAGHPSAGGSARVSDHAFEGVPTSSKGCASHSRGTHRRLRPDAVDSAYRIVLKRVGDPLERTGGWGAVLYRGEVVIDVLPGLHSRQIHAKLAAHETWGWHVGIRVRNRR